ncbi:MAG TPA: hypothetical protein VD997_11645 [Phycisphaerales bacterium]|nr:hypothetical protein [Phycisphaerales bacterium]
MPPDPESLPPAIGRALAFLRTLDRGPKPLMAYVRRAIDDSMLLEIANADYGNDSDEHLAALRRLRDQAQRLDLSSWYPREVLELIRWSEPDDPRCKPGSTGERGHIMRAFACAHLIECLADRSNNPYCNAENETLIQLIDSCIAVGCEAEDAVWKFVLWRALNRQRDEETPHYALAVLILAVRRNPPLTPEVLNDLATWVEAEVGSVPTDSGTGGGRWLFDLSFHDLQRSRWIALARYNLLLPARPHPPAAADALTRIGSLAVIGS